MIAVDDETLGGGSIAVDETLGGGSTKVGKPILRDEFLTTEVMMGGRGSNAMEERVSCYHLGYTQKRIKETK